jgi:hypothetical protein
LRKAFVSGCRFNDNALSGFVKLIKQMAKFRKKPVVIEATQFLCKKNHPSFPESQPTSLPDGVIKKKFTDYQDPAPYWKWGIETLEGFMECSDGDWVITGVNGEKYPCKPDIFEKTYEKVED